jgi:NagD protein
VRLDDVAGFMFDVDGTLVHRGSDGRGRPIPGAVELLEAIRASGRRFVLFTNGSHVPAWELARGLREDGLPLRDDEVITPVESAITYLRRNHPGLDIRLGLMGGSRTVLVRSGTSGAIDLAGVPEARRPDLVVDSVADLLALV